MNERALRKRLSWIVRFGTPVSLLLTACGGATDGAGASGGGAGSPAGGTESGGGTSGGTGSGGTAAGGTGTGGTGTGGAATGGATYGGAGSGGAATGGTGTGGAANGGAASGGTGMGGAANGGGPNCNVATGGLSSQCSAYKSYELDAACAEPELTDERCKSLCATTWSVSACTFSASANPGKVILVCPPTCVAGRRPTGFTETQLESSGAPAYFTRMAELEAAAVPAFRQLRAELHEHGAPRTLLRALSRAARDERRHARAVGSLARRHGGQVAALRVTPRARRSLEAIALENVAEGCVRELFGALVASFQAEHVKDLEVRRVMQRIAHEETRHAALSLQVQRWLEQRLDRAARERVEAARERAKRELVAELDRPVAPELSAATGLPSAATAVALHRALFSDTSGT